MFATKMSAAPAADFKCSEVPKCFFLMLFGLEGKISTSSWSSLNDNLDHVVRKKAWERKDKGR